MSNITVTLTERTILLRKKIKEVMESKFPNKDMMLRFLNECLINEESSNIKNHE